MTIFCLKVKDWLQSLGIGDHPAVVHDDDDEPDDNVVTLNNEGSVRKR